MNIIKNLFKKSNKETISGLSEFAKNIDFAKNPFGDEQPEAIKIFDLNGNEVSADE